MAETTGNFGLTLPDENEFYDIEVFNENNRIVDEGMKNIADSVKQMAEEVAKSAGSYENMKCGSVTEAGDIVFDYKEIDTLVNEGETDLTVSFFNASGTKSGDFTLRAGEVINDMQFTGSKISIAAAATESETSEAAIAVRYILLG